MPTPLLVARLFERHLHAENRSERTHHDCMIGLRQAAIFRVRPSRRGAGLQRPTLAPIRHVGVLARDEVRTAWKATAPPARSTTWRMRAFLLERPGSYLTNIPIPSQRPATNSYPDVRRR